MRGNRTIAIIFGAFSLLFAVASSFATETKPAAITVFQGVKVFDGTRWISPCTVIIQGDEITAVGPDLKVPQGAEVIGGQGLTLIPGLIDSHAHAFSLGDLRQSAIFGVTSLMDMMSTPAFMRQVKARLNGPGGADLADFHSAGTAAVCPGGHGTEWGSEVPTLTRPEEAAGFIDARLAEGSEYLKIMSGMAKRVLPMEVIEALAREAKKRGILTLTHTETRATALANIKAGVNGLAHAFADVPPETDFIEAMKAARAFVIPTLSVMHRLKDARKIALVADKRFTDYLVPEVIDSLTNAKYPPDSPDLFYQVAEETVRRLNQAGIPVLVGTDLGNPGLVPGASLHTELERLTFAGLTPTEALMAATSRPADIFGLKDRGRIAAGLRADLLLVKGDPEKAITDTREIAGVWLRGVRLDRAAYRSEMERQKKEWKDSGEIPPPIGSESGLICDFDSGDDMPRFGFYFFDIADKMMGGASSVALSLAGNGADGTPGSLTISGKIEPKSPMPFAGVCYFPGALVDSYANLSRWDAVSFWVKGDVSQGTVMIMADMRKAPGMKPFPISGEWRKVTVPFKDLGSDGKNIMGLIVGAANTPGPFHIQIDDLRFVKQSK